MNDQFIREIASNVEAIASNHNEILNLIDRAILIEENPHKNQSCHAREDMIEILNNLKMRLGVSV